MSKKKPKKKSYLICTPVVRASGTQHWRVTASSPEEALEKHRRGQSDFEFEEVEVTALGEPEIIEEVDIE